MILNRYRLKMIVIDPEGDKIEAEGSQIAKDKYNAIMKETELNIKIGYKIEEILSIRKVGEVNIN